MKENTVLRKTTKGLDEIKTRDWKLSSQSRMVLIMVNGELSTKDLHLRLDNISTFESAGRIEEILHKLVKNRFVTATNKYADNISSDYGEQRWSEHKIIRVKDRLIGRASRILGKHALKIAKKLDNSANTMEGLAIAIDESKKIVKLFIDEKLATSLANQWQVIIREERVH